jgi:hypothetical protein
MRLGMAAQTIQRFIDRDSEARRKVVVFIWPLHNCVRSSTAAFQQ